MATDALDPGPNGDYPYFPRDVQGRPIWSDAQTGEADTGTYMPRGVQAVRGPASSGRGVLVDLTPRHADGTEIDPPVIQPDAPTAL